MVFKTSFVSNILEDFSNPSLDQIMSPAFSFIYSFSEATGESGLIVGTQLGGVHPQLPGGALKHTSWKKVTKQEAEKWGPQARPAAALLNSGRYISLIYFDVPLKRTQLVSPLCANKFFFFNVTNKTQQNPKLRNPWGIMVTPRQVWVSFGGNRLRCFCCRS